MSTSDKPHDERERLASLRNLKILDTPAEEKFDRITRLAKKSLGASISLISLVDEDRQWFKSNQGLQTNEMQREASFCGYTILGEEQFVVPDARLDPRFSNNQLVTGATQIRSYAGQPIHSPDGHRIGTLCVFHASPEHFGVEELQLLDDLATLAENELRVDQLGRSERKLRDQLTEVERRASVDGLTRLWNRESILRLLDVEIERAVRSGDCVAVALVDIDRFKRVNDELGHLVGDDVLRTVAERLRSAARAYDSVGRFGGEEFLVVIAEPDQETALHVAERVRERVARIPVRYSNGELQVSVSVGVCTRHCAADLGRDDILAAADQAMYAAKQGGRNRVAVCSADSEPTP